MVWWSPAVTSLFETHVTHVTNVDQRFDLPAAWEELMVVVESSMAGGRKEVALAAIGLLSGVLQAHAKSPSSAHSSLGGPQEGGGGSGTGQGAASVEAASRGVVSEAMWKRAMRATDVGVEAATTPTCQVPLQVSQRLVSLVAGWLAGWLGAGLPAQQHGGGGRSGGRSSRTRGQWRCKGGPEVWEGEGRGP